MLKRKLLTLLSVLLVAVMGARAQSTSESEIVIHDVTIAEAIEIASALEPSAKTEDYYRVTATLKDLKTALSNIPNKYTNINCTLEDETGEILSYYTNYLNNEPFTSADQVPAVGTKIIVVGRLYNYSTTPEFTRGYIEQILEEPQPQPADGITFNVTVPENTPEVYVYYDVLDVSTNNYTTAFVQMEKVDDTHYKLFVEGISSDFVDGINSDNKLIYYMYFAGNDYELYEIRNTEEWRIYDPANEDIVEAWNVKTIYYLTGECDLFGNWDPQALQLENGSYTFEQLPAGDYQFKITDGTWDNSWGKDAIGTATGTASGAMLWSYGNDNARLYISKASKVTFSFDGSHINVTASPNGTNYYLNESYYGSEYEQELIFWNCSNNTYSKTKDKLEGTHEFYISDNSGHTWGSADVTSITGAELLDGTNIKIKLTKTSHVSFIFDGEHITINVEPICLSYYVTVPENTPAVYLAGGWNWDEFLPMEKWDDTHYFLCVENATESHNYKYYCGEGEEYAEQRDGDRSRQDYDPNTGDVVTGWSAELTYNVTVPKGTPNVFICGEFNNYGFTEMTKVDDTHYTVTIEGATPTDHYRYHWNNNSNARESFGNAQEWRSEYNEQDVVAAWAYYTYYYLTGESLVGSWDVDALFLGSRRNGDYSTAISFKQELPAGEYAFKVTKNASWDNALGYSAASYITEGIDTWSGEYDNFVFVLEKPSYVSIFVEDNRIYLEVGMSYYVEVPNGTETVYISGDFNDWTFTPMTKHVEEEDYGNWVYFSVEVPYAHLNDTYKYFWQADTKYREIDDNGNDIENRHPKVDESGYFLFDYVARWRTDASLTLSPAAIEGLVYNGEAQALVTAGRATGGTLYYWLDEEHFSSSVPTAINAGEYTVNMEIYGDKAHNTITLDPIVVNIAKANINITAAPAPVNDLVFNGEPQVLVAAGSADFGTILYSLDNQNFSAELPKATDARTYEVYYRVDGDQNHNATETLTLQAKIAIAAVEYTAPEPIQELEYNGEPQVLINAGEALGGTMLYSLDGENFSAELPTATDAGTYDVFYRVDGDDNHTDVAPQSFRVEIARADINYVAPRPISGLVFTGNPQVLVIAGSAVGGTMRYSLNGADFTTALPKATNVGVYEVFYRIDGDQNHNSVAPQSFTVEIARADISYTAPQARQGMVYSGTPQALVSAGTAEAGYFIYWLDNQQPSREVPTAVNAGEYTVNFKLVGDESHNDIEFEPVVATIEKNVIIVTAPVAVKGLVYNGQPQTLIVAGKAQVFIAADLTDFGTMLYSLDGENFSAELPAATNVGVYEVFYRIDGDQNHNSVAAQSLQVRISADKAALQQAINDATAFHSTISNLYPEIAQELNDAIWEAQMVNGNADATQTEVDDATQALLDALEKARRDAELAAQAITIIVPAGEFATGYYDHAITVSDPNVELYTITSIDGDAVYLTQITTAAPYTPFLIYNPTSSDITVTLEATDATPTDVTPAPQFKGTTEVREMPASNGSVEYYIFTGTSFVYVDESGTIPANKCWLELPVNSGNHIRRILFGPNGGPTTGLEDAEAEEVNGPWFDLNGRLLGGEPEIEGIYIHNGKKVLIRRK